MAANATGGSGGRSAYNSQVVTLQENAETGVQPFVEVTYTSATQGGGQTQTIKTTISGSQTKSMTIQSDTVGIQTVRCRITHPTAALNEGQATLPSEENESDVNWFVLFPAVNNVLILEILSEANPVTALASTATVVFPLIEVNSDAVLPVASPPAITIV